MCKRIFFWCSGIAGIAACALLYPSFRWQARLPYRAALRPCSSQRGCSQLGTNGLSVGSGKAAGDFSEPHAIQHQLWASEDVVLGHTSTSNPIPSGASFSSTPTNVSGVSCTTTAIDLGDASDFDTATCIMLLSECDGPSPEAADSTFEEYIRLHGREAVMSSKVCNRTFFYARFECPSSFGNNLHSLLNSFAYAIITNRTLVLNVPRKRKRSCEEYFQSQWLLSVVEVDALRESQGCPLPAEQVQTIKSSQTVPLAATLARCCPLDAPTHIDAPVLQWAIGRFEHWLADQLFWITMNRGLRHRLVHACRAQGVFGNGRLYGYHMLWKKLFVGFSQLVTRPVDDMLASWANYTKIGVHVRHSWSHGDGVMLKCVDKLLQKNCKDQKCIVLLASDSNETLPIFERQYAGMLDAVLQTPRIYDVESVCGGDRPREDCVRDHGSFTGATAMMDLYMLGRSSVLVGFGDSTFYQFAAALFTSSPERSRHTLDAARRGCPQLSTYSRPFPTSCSHSAGTLESKQRVNCTEWARAFHVP